MALYNQPPKKKGEGNSPGLSSIKGSNASQEDATQPTMSAFGSRAAHSCSPDRVNHFCCRLPSTSAYVPPYYNPQNRSERAGLAPKQPGLRQFATLHSPAPNASTERSMKGTAKLRHFTRPVQQDIDKCQVYLHSSVQSAASRKRQVQQSL